MIYLNRQNLFKAVVYSLTLCAMFSFCGCGGLNTQGSKKSTTKIVGNMEESKADESSKEEQSKPEYSLSAISETDDDVSTIAEETSSKGKNENYYEFNLQLSARDGNFIYTCDDNSEDNIDRYEINGNSSQLPFDGCRVCVDGELIYYVQTLTDENGEKTWGLYSYSKNSEKITFYLEVQRWTEFLLKYNDVIYYQEGEQINSYDINSHKKDVILKDSIISSYATESKIYYLSNTQTDGGYLNNGILKYFDLDNKESGVLLNEKIEKYNIRKSGSNVIFWTTDKEKHPQSAQIFKVNMKNNTIDPVKELKTEGELFFIACYSDIFVYQEFNYQTGNYSTSALTLTDGRIQTDNNANLQLIAMNSHSVGNEDESVLRDESIQKNYFFDINCGKLKQVTNSEDDRAITYYYCDGEVCMYKAYGNNKQSAAEMLKLSEKLPSKEEVFKNGIKSSPDGEYVHVKMFVPNTCGYVSPVPELTIDSDDVRKINSQLESTARDSEYNMYYRYLVSDDYLTLFTYAGYTGGGYYKIYTLDISTGKQLTNDEIIALYSDDDDAFWEALREEYKYQQDFTYNYGYSQMEADLSGIELIKGPNQLSKEEIERYAAQKSLENFQLGYYGKDKLICSASFKNRAGADYSVHIFDFQFE